mmetsp:Transcript_11832/g.35903  ORF Transcript_11832/g.35903 Transcript_11832/m.35903 type:complete len:204 (-) Transcript_11832:767-1378(-)
MAHDDVLEVPPRRPEGLVDAVLVAARQRAALALHLHHGVVQHAAGHEGVALHPQGARRVDHVHLLEEEPRRGLRRLEALLVGVVHELLDGGVGLERRAVDVSLVRLRVREALDDAVAQPEDGRHGEPRDEVLAHDDARAVVVHALRERLVHEPAGRRETDGAQRREGGLEQQPERRRGAGAERVPRDDELVALARAAGAEQRA